MSKLLIHIIGLMLILGIFSGVSESAGIMDRVFQETLDFPGRIGLCARNLNTGEEIHFHSQEKFPTASAIKTGIMVEFFCQQAEGLLSLDDPCVVLDEEKVGGSGTIQDSTGPYETTYREMIELMITISDNTATNECIDGIGGLWDGIHAMNLRMEGLGLQNTKLLNKMMWFKTKTKSLDSLRYGVGVTTPEDLVLLYERIYRGLIADRETCDQMLEILKRQKYNSMIPGELPKDSQFSVVVAHKTGSVGDAVIDAGIVYTSRGDYVIALFVDGTDEDQWHRMMTGKEEMGIPSTRKDWPGENAAVQKLARLSRIVFDYFYETDSGEQE